MLMLAGIPFAFFGAATFLNVQGDYIDVIRNSMKLFSLLAFGWLLIMIHADGYGLSIDLHTYPEAEQRWIGLHHAQDEAIASLRAVSSHRPILFEADHLLGLSSATAAIICAGVFVGVLMAELQSISNLPIYSIAVQLHQAAVNATVFHSWTELAYTEAAKHVFRLELSLGVSPLASLASATSLIILSVLLALAPFAWIVLFIAAKAVVARAYKCVGIVTSSILNSIFHRQILRRALGIDEKHLHSMDVTAKPWWVSRQFPSLGRVIADSIERRAIADEGGAIARVRQLIWKLSESTATHDLRVNQIPFGALANTIHTSYFESETFVKYIACTISNLDGFAPTQALENDSEFETVKAECERHVSAS
ncbi:MAG: hypothetical protein ABL962_21410, partial [Fimbriimonadaceae bacterium]